MGLFKRKKSTLSLVLSIFIIVIVLFINLINSQVSEISKGIAAMESHRKKSVEDFFDLSVGIQHNFVGIIKEDWIKFNEDGGGTTEEFVRYSLKSIPNSAIDSIIIAIYDGEVVYRGFKIEQYSYINFLDNLDLNENDSRIKIYGDDQQKSFGEGERFYYTNATLDKELVVVVGFLEDVMYNQFISSLNIDAARYIERKNEQVLTVLTSLMFTVIVFGLFLVFYLIKLENDITPEKICSIRGELVENMY